MFQLFLNSSNLKIKKKYNNVVQIVKSAFKQTLIMTWIWFYILYL